MGCVTCVEWGSRVDEALPEERIDLWIEVSAMDEPYVPGEVPRAPRRLVFTASGPDATALLAARGTGPWTCGGRREVAQRLRRRRAPRPRRWPRPPLARADPDAGARAWLFLGADGRPLRQVVLGFATRGEGGTWILDGSTPGQVVELPRGRLAEASLPPGDPEALVAWGEGLAATHVGRPGGRDVVGVRLLPARPLEGRVRLARGRPAAGAELVATRTEGGGLVHRTRTAADGRWRLPWLAGGDWALSLRRPDGRRQGLGTFVAGEAAELGELVLDRGGSVTLLLLDGDASRRTPAPNVRLSVLRLPVEGGRTPAQVVTAADGTARVDGLEDAIYEVHLPDGSRVFDPVPPRFEAREGVHLEIPAAFVVRKRGVTGRIEDPRGAPIAGAEVHVVPDPTRLPPVGGWDLPPPTRTDRDGRFRVESLVPDAAYRLLLSAPGYAPQLSDPVEVRRGRDAVLPSVRLVRGWRVEVRARTTGGRPVGGVRVVAYPASHPVGDGEARWDALARDAVTNEEGIAIVGDLAAEDARVVAGGGPWMEVSAVVPYPRTGDVRVFNAALLRAPRLDGQLQSEAGGTLPPVRIEARPHDGSPVRETRPSADGTFVFEGLTAVPTDLVVRSAAGPEGPPLARYESAMPGQATPVTILVPALLTIAGRVVAAGRAGEDGARVAVELEAPLLDMDADRYRWRTVARQVIIPEPDGTPFAFVGLAPGAYAVRLVRGSLDSEAVPVLLDEGSVEGLTLSLPAGGRVAGTVLDDRDRPRMGADVRLTRLRGDGDAVGGPEALHRKATDADGAYVFEDVAPGLWRLEARDHDAAPHVMLLRIEEGESTLAEDIVLGPGGTLEGRVADEGGRGLDGARLRLESARDGVDAREVRTGEDGRFVAVRLAPGVWRVRLDARAGSFTGLEAIVEVVAGETTHVDLAARGRGRIQGTVRRRGRPVPDVVVTLVGRVDEEGAALRRLFAHTDVRGEFLWDGLVEGEYVVDVLDGVVRSTRAVALEDGDHLDLDLEVWDGRIPGRVLTAAGRGAPGVEVVARPRERPGPEVAARTRTGPDGRFVLAGLPPGIYDLLASAPGRPPGVLRGVAAEVPPAERLAVIPLGQGGILDVDVLNPDGRGIAGARIWLEDEAGQTLHPHAFPTTGSGRLRLVGIPPGRHFVRVDAPRYGRVARAAVVVREADTSALVFRLGPPATLGLKVTFEGSPAGRAWTLTLLRADTGEVVARRQAPGFALGTGRSVALSRTGRVEIDDLSGGTYVVRIEAGDAFDVLEEPIEVEAGEETRLDLFVAQRVLEDD